MKKLLRFTCALLVLAMLLPATVYAAEETRASAYFGATSATLERTSDGFRVWVDLTCKDIMDEVGASAVGIQRSTDGENWTTLEIFTRDEYPEMIRENFFIHTFSVDYTAEPGYYYRAYVFFYAQKGTGIGEYFQYTSVLKL